MHSERNRVWQDPFLEERLADYDRWLREGGIRFSSRVVPVGEVLEAEPWVVPQEQVIEFLRGARSFALAPCACRSHYRRCNNPLEVCFLLDETADRHVKEGLARRVTLAEAKERLRLADRRGLVHLTIFMPPEKVYAVCSCCPCCCHELQILKRYGRVDLVARSDYVAQTDVAACVGCGACVGRCVFGARRVDENRMHYAETACYGCGLCITACPAGATRLARRNEEASRAAPIRTAR